MNILVRAIGVSGTLPPDWFRVPSGNNVWVYDLRSDNADCLRQEIIEISELLRQAAKHAERLVLHIGKYDDVTCLNLDNGLLEIILRANLELEVY